MKKLRFSVVSLAAICMLFAGCGKMNAASEIQIETTGAQERQLAITTFQEAADVSAGNVSTEFEQRHQVDKRYTEQLRCVYLSPRYDSNASMEGLKNIYLNKDESFLSEALKPAAQNPVFVDGVMLVYHRFAPAHTHQSYGRWHSQDSVDSHQYLRYSPLPTIFRNSPTIKFAI